VEVTKEEAQKYLSKVPEQNAFWCNNGAILRDMRELKDALTYMSEETYAYHSNAFKKDFSNWIRDIVGDEKLAKDLEAAPTRQDALMLVEQRCSLLNTEAE
jgi:hypothetical protein